MFLAAQDYDADESIVYVRHPQPVSLATMADLDRYFGEIGDFWLRRCRRPAYYVVNYDGLTTNAALVDAYTEHVYRLMRECGTLGLYRFGGGVAQRATGRIVMHRMKLSHLCGTREEVIRAIRRGRG